VLPVLIECLGYSRCGNHQCPQTYIPSRTSLKETAHSPNISAKHNGKKCGVAKYLQL